MKEKKIVIIDGQGGKIGRLLIEQWKASAFPQPYEIYAIGTNSTATAAMLKAGADYGATGENPVVVACRDADVVVGPLGIIAADSLLGEVTPAMAVAGGTVPRSQNPPSHQPVQPFCHRITAAGHRRADLFGGISAWERSSE